MDVRIQKGTRVKERAMTFLCVNGIRPLRNSPLRQKPHKYNNKSVIVPVVDRAVWACLTLKIKSYSNANQFFIA
jgi:hypothetical protein